MESESHSKKLLMMNIGFHIGYKESIRTFIDVG